MAKEKKVRTKVNWKKEAKLAPGYIILILWVLFTVVLLGWLLEPVSQRQEKSIKEPHCSSRADFI